MDDLHAHRLNVVRVIAVAAAVLLAACNGGGGSPPASANGTSRPRAPSTTASTLAPSAPYAPLPGEPLADAKRAAAELLQTIATYPRGEGTLEGAKARLAQRNLAPQLADPAGSLLVTDAASAADVVYPQLGGMTATDASVMVVLRQRLHERNTTRAVTRTIDVRVRRSGASWAVSAIASLGGDPVDPPPTLSDAARRVLADSRIEMPDSARWDIAAGRVAPRVVDLVADLATRHRLSITVFASGHPPNVFHRRSLSNHTRGRAVDIWGVDGRPVLEQRDPAGPLAALVKELIAAGVNELGSPFAFGSGSFTDTVHQDHLHLGFDA